MEFLKEITPREYQKQIFETAKEANTLVVLPTGLGKTLIALMLTIQRMQRFPGKKVLFLAPTKPLAQQHQESFKKYLPELFGEMTLFTGAVTAQNRKKLFTTADIIFSTPQCIANDVKQGRYYLDEICLLIEDEAHRCLKNYDYTFIAKKYLAQAPKEIQRLIGLTASPGSDAQTIKDICRNLAIEKVEVKSRDDPDVKQYLQELDFKKVEVDFPKEFMEIRALLAQIYDQYVDELRARKVLHGPATKVGLIMLQKRLGLQASKGTGHYSVYLAMSTAASAIKISHAQELLETQTLQGLKEYLKKLFDEAAANKSKGVKRLTAKKEFNAAYTLVSELIAKNKEHPKIQKAYDLISQEQKENAKAKVILFTQFRDTAQTLAKKLSEHKNLKAEIFVGQAKKKSSSGQSGLSQKEQRAMIERFSQGESNVLVATSIGEEGLDIPEVNAVIFYEPVPSAIRKIQRAGRTARLKEGKLFILVTKKTRDEAYYYVAGAKEKKMYSAIEKVSKSLENDPQSIYQKTERQKTL